MLRTDFSAGWLPDADAATCPPNGVLRADNLTLDELGVLALRKGATKINGSPFSDTDVHSLFTAVLNGTRYRMAGAGAAVYANGSSIVSGFAGSNDIAFGSHMGQILMARSTTKKKYDGSTVRNLGIAMTGGTPTIAPATPDAKTFFSCDSGEAGTIGIESSGWGAPSYTANRAGAANSAIRLTPASANGREVVAKIFASDQDFRTYPGGTTGTDDDIIELYINLAEPAEFVRISLTVGVNGPTALSGSGSQLIDYYNFVWTTQDQPMPPPDTQDPDAEGHTQDNIDAHTQSDNNLVTKVQPVKGWQRLFVRRGWTNRIGSTSGKDWGTVRSVRVTVETTGTATVDVDDVVISGGALTGKYFWKYVLAYNSGTYTALSAPSAASAETQLSSQGADVTAPADGSRDSQTNEIWLFRRGGDLDAFYRVAVKTGVSGTGAVVIPDAASDKDALITNIRLETDNVVPPDTILDIEGPYYDRTFYLTATHLYPSRRRNPDSCAAGQAIRVSGADEVAYWVKKAFGGLYIGTSKDIYVLEGTGAELPDDTIDFTLRAMNIDAPPVSDAVTQDGNLLIYLAHDGWRAVAGGGSQSLVYGTSLLYRGYTRHGVSAINMTTGRFRAAVAMGRLVAITPEGASTTFSGVLYRHPIGSQRWERSAYGALNFRSIHREPDGTLIVGDTAGTVWTLDTGTQDHLTDLSVTVWTRADDDGQPFVRKDPIDLRLHLDTGGATLTTNLHRDSSAASALTVTGANNGLSYTVDALSGLAAYRQVQLRMTGTFSTFRLAGYGVNHALLPAMFKGQLPRTHFGDPHLKTLSGLQLRVCTLGIARTFTPYLDGTAGDTFSVTSATDEPTDYTHAFTSAQEATELALGVDGDVELYEWTPLTTAKRPLGIKAWDSGPLDLGVQDLVWIREVRLKVNAGGDLTVTPYFDDIAFAAVTLAVGSDANKATILSVPVGRGYVGRTPRLVITSSAAFYPYWVEFVRRSTAAKTEKAIIRVPAPVGGMVAA